MFPKVHLSEAALPQKTDQAVLSKALPHALCHDSILSAHALFCLPASLPSSGNQTAHTLMDAILSQL
jgi:hypothetical protein